MDEIKFQVIRRGILGIERFCEPFDTRNDAEQVCRLLRQLKPATYEILESVIGPLNIPFLLDPGAPEDTVVIQQIGRYSIEDLVERGEFPMPR